MDLFCFLFYFLLLNLDLICLSFLVSQDENLDLILDLSAFLIYAFHVIHFPLSTALISFHGVWYVVVSLLFSQNILKFLLRSLLCPVCYLEGCYLISKYLGNILAIFLLLICIPLHSIPFAIQLHSIVF